MIEKNDAGSTGPSSRADIGIATGCRQRWQYLTVFLVFACLLNLGIFEQNKAGLSMETVIETAHAINNTKCDHNGNSNASESIWQGRDFSTDHQYRPVNYAETRSIISKDWYNRERFDAQFEHRCLVVDNICHSSGRWWYIPMEKGVDGYQPSFTLQTNLLDVVGYPEIVNVSSIADSDDVQSQQMYNRQCATSPIINHIIMYSFYNTMLGEFYVRILKGLFEISQTADNYIDFLEQTQLYVHMYNKNHKTLLESHHIFTDIFRGHPLLDVKVLLHNAGCRCFQRLFLCGYKIDPHERTDQMNLTKTERISISPGYGIEATNQEEYKEVRKALRTHLIDENPFIQADIQEYRELVLRNKNVEGNFDEWKVIGLSQRSGRRRWIGLTEIEQECNVVFRSHQIICIEVNVESAEFHPYNHAVVHGALDALFGIHGAQITEAMWMKSGSLVVEFLPWVHEVIRMGTWTRSVQSPTPIGIMFVDTDLNYIGFPLTRHSAPYCYELEREKEIDCWRSNHWDERNFMAPKNSIIDAVTMFFVNTTDDPSCIMYNEWAADDFVLYNIYCRAENESLAIHHFPWEERLEDLPKYANYSNFLQN